LFVVCIQVLSKQQATNNQQHASGVASLIVDRSSLIDCASRSTINDQRSTINEN
jgi:hypothetical protein